MRWHTLDGGNARTLVAVLDPGDEVIERLTAVIRSEAFGAALITAVGGFARAEIGRFDRHTGQYRPVAVDEQCEVLSMLGEVTVRDGTPELQLQADLGLFDGSTRGGQLLAAEVWPSLEVVVRESRGRLRKRPRPARQRLRGSQPARRLGLMG